MLSLPRVLHSKPYLNFCILLFEHTFPVTKSRFLYRFPWRGDVQMDHHKNPHTICNFCRTRTYRTNFWTRRKVRKKVKTFDTLKKGYSRRKTISIKFKILLLLDKDKRRFIGITYRFIHCCHPIYSLCWNLYTHKLQPITQLHLVFWLYNQV